MFKDSRRAIEEGEVFKSSGTKVPEGAEALCTGSTPRGTKPAGGRELW